MREILFRGKSMISGEWVFGTPVCVEENTYPTDRVLLVRAVNYDELDNSLPQYESEEVDPATVGQFTELYDMNGKRVFEGDIIVRYQVDNDDCPFPNKDTKPRVGRVFFSDYRASFSLAMGLNGSDSLNSDLFRYIRGGGLVEVIGNIHDNPELLEEKEE